MGNPPQKWYTSRVYYIIEKNATIFLRIFDFFVKMPQSPEKSPKNRRCKISLRKKSNLSLTFVVKSTII